MLVVKADAYGHGARAVARQAWAEGVTWFAVAHWPEALELRAVVPDARIVLLGVLDPAEVAAAVAHRITPILTSETHAGHLSAAALRAGVRLTCHWKLDTGMGRLGLMPDAAGRWAEHLLRLRGLEIEGGCSHFAAVEPGNPELAARQFARFAGACEQWEKSAGWAVFRHLSSTRAFLYHPEWDLDAVRTGILAYGYGGHAPNSRAATVPCLEWKARLIDIKTVPADSPVGYYGTYRTRQTTDLGIVCVGYADGLPRTLSNRGFVLAGGARRPLVGRISMNWAAIELGPRCGLSVGDEVVLLGQQGPQRLRADELARWAGTIPYEVLTAISPRLPRTYGRALGETPGGG